ncbi:DUF5694 domain-containing protein [Fictibacillus nanhaiensis]|uniref:DUF5694 domain-containing protein n=1 Tax=Fictibacillus nanhaiensis TaxID=742169 RepID=UPI003AF31A18
MERELRICKNLVDILTNQEDECVMLLIGSDHLWMLKKLFEGSGWKVTNPFVNN